MNVLYSSMNTTTAVIFFSLIRATLYHGIFCGVPERAGGTAKDRAWVEIRAYLESTVVVEWWWGIDSTSPTVHRDLLLYMIYMVYSRWSR